MLRHSLVFRIISRLRLSKILDLSTPKNAFVCTLHDPTDTINCFLRRRMNCRPQRNLQLFLPIRVWTPTTTIRARSGALRYTTPTSMSTLSQFIELIKVFNHARIVTIGKKVVDGD
jgi:hypothetical protein